MDLDLKPKIRTFLQAIAKPHKSRLISLYDRPLSDQRVETIRTHEEYGSVFDDLMRFTGLSADEVAQRIARTPQHHFISEFRWVAPSDERELVWYYRVSQAYLFANASHGYWKKLDYLSPDGDRVLDYGAGAGNNVVGLSARGFDVDYLEINALQQQFIQFRCERHALDGARSVRPFFENSLNPVHCVTGPYRAVVLQDVLEHVPNYHSLLRHLIGCLMPNGIIIENSPFATKAAKIDIHLSASMPLEEAMVGMRQVQTGIWEKREDTQSK